VQEHFSASIKEWRGVHVMTIHKSKGKEFNEVVIYEGTHNGKIVWQGADERKKAQAKLTLRVGVTRAMQRASILTPASDPCPFL
jgi:DNA helicase-2/ATP-dependent DNA helicase PcrA